MASTDAQKMIDRIEKQAEGARALRSALVARNKAGAVTALRQMKVGLRDATVITTEVFSALEETAETV